MVPRKCHAHTAHTPSLLPRAAQVIIRTLTDKKIRIDVDLDEKISHVKALFQQKEGTPKDQQRLIFGGKQMEDDKTLSRYYVKPGDIINIVLRLRGGAGGGGDGDGI